jgi:hypothetical protein
MKRRQFLKTTGLAFAGAGIAKPAIAQTSPAIKWRLTSSYPKSLDTLYSAVIEPCILLTSVEPKRNRGEQGKSGVLAKIIIRRGVTSLDGTVADRIHRIETWDDFSGCKVLYLEPIIGPFCHHFRDGLAGRWPETDE